MIRLTLESGEPIYFNPDHIKAFTPVEEVTHIYPDEGVFSVTESPEEVARKVLEWKIAYKNNNTDYLYRLAGLKTPWEKVVEKSAETWFKKHGLEESEHG